MTCYISNAHTCTGGRFSKSIQDHNVEYLLKYISMTIGGATAPPTLLITGYRNGLSQTRLESIMDPYSHVNTLRPRQMDAISQTPFSSAFS